MKLKDVPIKYKHKGGDVHIGYVIKNGKKKYHCDDGPAFEWNDEPLRKEYWVDGKVHREDGPAICFSDGKTQWYMNDYQVTDILAPGEQPTLDKIRVK